MRKVVCALTAVGFLLLSAPLSATPAPNEQSRFLVTFHSRVRAPGPVAQELSRAHGFGLRHIYRFALNGMAIEVPAAAELQVLRALRRDPRVASIGRDRTVYLTAQQVAKDLNRINGEPGLAPNTGSSVQVAIIDSGLDFGHPDLAANIDTSLSRNCTDGGGGCALGGQDDHGHGTSVGGIVAALDNGIDLVGVAPQATLIAVKVFRADGSADYIDIVAGVDYLTGLNLGGNVIEVANMSFRDNCPTCTDDSTDPTVVAFHDAVRALVSSGTTVVAAAGNDSADSSGSVPASFDEVITVSAMGDSDGIPGGFGPPLCLFWFFSCFPDSEVADDSFAQTAFAGFSNFGADVDVVAPGVGVPILQLGGGALICTDIDMTSCSGTSFASPHAVGVAALFIQDRLDKGLQAPLPGIVRQALIETGECYESGAGAGGLFHGTAGCPSVWPADPDGLAEPLVRADNVVNFAASAVHDVAVTSVSAPSPVAINVAQDVSVGVENQGTESETFDVSLADDSQPAAAITPGPQSVTLDPGGFTSVTFSWTPSSAGNHILTGTASSVGGETDMADNTDSTTITVQAPTRDVAVGSITAPASVLQGDTAAISVVVDNKGTEDESVTVDLVADEGAVQSTSTQPMTVTVGQSATFTFNWDTTLAAPGNHTLTATANLEGATDSNPADNAQSTSVEVLAPVHDVAVTGIISQDVVNQPDTLGIQVDLTNEGTFEESFEVLMTDAPAAGGGTPGEWSSALPNPAPVTLAAGASTSLIFIWETANASAGDHVLTATASTVAGETDMADNAKSKTVNVSVEVVDLSINSVTAPASMTEGTIADVSVEVENLGTVEMTVTVSVADTPSPGGTAGAVSAAQEVTLAGGALTTLTFTWDTTLASAGDHVLSSIFSPVGGDGIPGNNFNQTVSTVLLAAPSNLTASAGAEVTGRGRNKTVTAVWVDLAWDDNSNSEDGYAIERAEVTVTGKGKKKTTTVGPYSVVDTTVADVTSYQDNSAESGKTYRYRVKATHNDTLVDDSPYSNEAEAETK